MKRHSHVSWNEIVRRLFMQKPSSAVHSRATGRKLFRFVVTAALAGVLSGCVLHKPFLFRPSSVTKITYDPKTCTQMPDGKFKCRDVVFTVSTVEPAKLH
jgi:hypothetical protein